MNDWLFDLGNTRVKCAPLLPDGRVGEPRILAYDARDPSSHLPDGGTAWLASVASPARRRDLGAGLSARFERVREVSTRAECAGLRIAYPDPRQLGVDRFLALLAAHVRGGGPRLVVGVGTALTIDLLEPGGRHAGGRIAPSPTLMREALHGRAAQLPRAGGRFVDFATGTADALASGCEGAAAALVTDSLARALALTGVAPGLLVHGGGAEALAAHLPGAEFAPALVLEGLAAWVHHECPGDRPADPPGT